jgi:hypothetical protein
MPDLRARAEQVSDEIVAHAKAVGRSAAFVKIALVLGGSIMIAFAQCATLPTAGGWPVWTVIGLIGTALALVGGLFLAFTERSASTALATAHGALEDAREAQADFESVIFYIEEVKRATELYGATMLMRRALETFLAGSEPNFDAIPSTLLDIADHQLLVALDFQVAQHWSIGVYRVETQDGGGRVMRCVAQLRSIKCEVSEARLWPDGRGAGWIALTNGNDVVIPDIKSPAMGTIFDGMLKSGDIDRFRSIAAVPIILAHSDEKWGAVVATSDQEDHFALDDRPGVRPIEGAKALAGMVALAMAARGPKKSEPSS